MSLESIYNSSIVKLQDASNVNQMGKLTKVGVRMEPQLDESKYKGWLQALMRDDVCTVEHTLQNADIIGRKELLNGTFLFENDIPICVVKHIKGYVDYRVNKPWAIAAISHALDSMKSMLSYDVDVYQTDNDGNNVVHVLVMMAYLDTSLEKRMNETYTFLKENLRTEQLKGLLHRENQNGYRPIELAVHLDCLQIFQNIFKTDGVYFSREDLDSVYSIEWFNVDDYEGTKNGSRRHRSPLYALLLIQDAQAEEEVTKCLFDSPFVQTWTKLKMQSCMPYIIMWVALRVCYIGAFIFTDTVEPVHEVIDLTYNNTTPNYDANLTSSSSEIIRGEDCIAKNRVTVPRTIYIIVSFYLMFHSFIVVCFDIFESFDFMCTKKKHVLQTPRGLKRPIVNYGFYRISQFFQSFMLLLNITSRNTSTFTNNQMPRTIENLFYINITLSIVWSFLFFVQLLPWIGHFVIAVQSMMMKLARFLVIFLVFSLPFIGSFQRLLNQEKYVGSCPEEFNSFGNSFYSVFMIMLNMVNLRDFSPADPFCTYALHGFYVFMTSILLINFLVALFSTSFARVDDNKKLIQTVQRLSVAWLVEERATRYFSKRVYDWFMKRSFPTKNGEIWFPCLKICSQQQDTTVLHTMRPGSANKMRKPIMTYMIR